METNDQHHHQAAGLLLLLKFSAASKRRAQQSLPAAAAAVGSSSSRAAVSAYGPRSRRQKSISVHDEKCVSRPINKRRADDSTQHISCHRRASRLGAPEYTRVTISSDYHALQSVHLSRTKPITNTFRRSICRGEIFQVRSSGQSSRGKCPYIFLEITEFLFNTV